MAKAPVKDPFRCSECGWTSTKWVGRCGECQAWGSVEEIGAPKRLSLVAGSVSQLAVPIGEVSIESARSRTSGVSELDRVLGSGNFDHRRAWRRKIDSITLCSCRICAGSDACALCQWRRISLTDTSSG